MVTADNADRVTVMEMDEHPLHHRVVVIGGGFGGLYAARELAKDKRVEPP